MKIHVDIDCTPEEARTLFGLPDVKPMQTALMQQIEGRMRKTLTAMEPEALFRMWLPASMQGLEQWQKFLWSRLSGSVGSDEDDDDDNDGNGEGKKR